MALRGGPPVLCHKQAIPDRIPSPGAAALLVVLQPQRRRAIASLMHRHRQRRRHVPGLSKDPPGLDCNPERAKVALVHHVGVGHLRGGNRGSYPRVENRNGRPNPVRNARPSAIDTRSTPGMRVTSSRRSGTVTAALAGVIIRAQLDESIRVEAHVEGERPVQALNKDA